MSHFCDRLFFIIFGISVLKNIFSSFWMLLVKKGHTIDNNIIIKYITNLIRLLSIKKQLMVRKITEITVDNNIGRKFSNFNGWIAYFLYKKIEFSTFPMISAALIDIAAPVIEYLGMIIIDSKIQITTFIDVLSSKILVFPPASNVVALGPINE
jgi:hypothetical protein